MRLAISSRPSAPTASSTSCSPSLTTLSSSRPPFPLQIDSIFFSELVF
ncbi:MAG: hypothetical protein Q8P67_14570 [archaeon]|nr:hypothetical protein [archaeon]